MSAAQFARFFGPAEQIAFVSPGHGFRLASRPVGATATPGFLRFSTAQMAELSRRRTTAQHLRIADYLRGSVPEKADGMSDDALIGYVRDVEPSGRVLGLRGERALGQWSYLMLASNGEIARSREVRVFVASGPGRPDDKMDALMRHMVDAAARAAAEPQR